MGTRSGNDLWQQESETGGDDGLEKRSALSAATFQFKIPTCDVIQVWVWLQILPFAVIHSLLPSPTVDFNSLRTVVVHRA